MRDDRRQQQPPVGRGQDQAIQRYQQPAPDTVVSREQKVSLASYDPGKYNVLYPTPAVMRVSPFHEVHVEAVVLSLREDDGDVYQDRLFCKGNERALRKNALHKLLRAAGGEWVPAECKCLDNGVESGLVRYRAGARIQKPDGTWQVVVAEKVVNVDEEFLDRRIRKSASKKDWWAEANERAREKYVRDEVDRHLEHAHSNAESKAKNRVIRELLQLKQKYTVDELQRPFIVPHLVYAPDYSDPEIRRLHMLAAAGAQADLYGQQALPGGGQEIVDAQARVEEMRNPEEVIAEDAITVGDAEDDDEWDDEEIPTGSEFESWREKIRSASTLEQERAVIADVNRRKKEGAFTPEQFTLLKQEAMTRLAQLTER